MNPTPEQATVIEQCKIMLHKVLSRYTGKLEFHFKKEKPNADQVDVKANFDIGKQ